MSRRRRTTTATPKAIAEAASRPTMRFVELKSEEQLDIQTLHRVRSRLVAARRTLLNQLRAILLERGHVFPQGRRKLEQAMEPCWLDPGLALGRRIRQLVADIRAEWQDLDQRIEALNGEFVALARRHDGTPAGDDPGRRRPQCHRAGGRDR